MQNWLFIMYFTYFRKTKLCIQCNIKQFKHYVQKKFIDGGFARKSNCK